MSANGHNGVQLHQAKKKIEMISFPFPHFNIVKRELNVGNDSPQTRKLSVKETGLHIFL